MDKSEGKSQENIIPIKADLTDINSLEQAFEKVITTREDDKYYSLDYRSSKANKENCDYFVSLHMNSATNKNAKGVEVLVYDEKSKLYTLSKDICSTLSKTINTPNRGVKISKSFSVLRKTKMPALLIEIDFISNSLIEASLKSDKYIKDISDSISKSLLSFVNKSIVDDGTFSNGCICSGSKDTSLARWTKWFFYKIFYSKTLIYLKTFSFYT